jgi:hypothetical protein
MSTPKVYRAKRKLKALIPLRMRARIQGENNPSCENCRHWGNGGFCTHFGRDPRPDIVIPEDQVCTAWEGKNA